jgi:hypothetical protein
MLGWLNLSNYVKTNPNALDLRSITLASYALCGFANFSSIRDGLTLIIGRLSTVTIKGATILRVNPYATSSRRREHSQGGAQPREQYLYGAHRAIRLGSDSREGASARNSEHTAVITRWSE